MDSNAKCSFCHMCGRMMHLLQGHGVAGLTRSGRSFPGLVCRLCRDLIESDTAPGGRGISGSRCVRCGKVIAADRSGSASATYDRKSERFCEDCSKPECSPVGSESDDTIHACFFCAEPREMAETKTVICHTQGGRNYCVPVCTYCVVRLNISEQDLD